MATPNLMHNYGKRILSLHCTLYVRLCTHMLYAGDHVSSRPVLVIGVRMIRNNPGNARACRRLCPVSSSFSYVGSESESGYKAEVRVHSKLAT